MPLPDAPIAGSFRGVVELFDAVVERAGEVEAFVHDGHRITFEQWGRAADGVATRLAAMGVRPGDVVGVS
ncbi:MAG: long-chain fatty acid--CoA ligase, partial [Actinobacteria bacterium]|nr:long-chain fatty acid--CoA ligase [Actinomycetota bacterium]